MAFSRATEDLEPNGEREDNVEREERDDKGDLDVEGARPEEDVAGMGMCEVIVDGGKSLPSRHTSTTSLTRSPCYPHFHSSESSQQHRQRLLQYKTLQTPSVYTILSPMVLAQSQQKYPHSLPIGRGSRMQVCSLSGLSLTHPIQWEETQDNLKLSMQRNVYGLHAPMRSLMERKIVADVTLPFLCFASFLTSSYLGSPPSDDALFQSAS